MQNNKDTTIEKLKQKNKQFQETNKDIIEQHVIGQSPKIAILTCADSRVIPEFIFNASIGDLFVVRVAGNVAIDETIIASLDYAVDHLHITHLIILGHTHCGAVKTTEKSMGSQCLLLHEIEQSFCLDTTNHIKANIQRQLEKLPQRSTSINSALTNKSLTLIGAIYFLEDGHVEFFE